MARRVCRGEGVVDEGCVCVAGAAAAVHDGCLLHAGRAPIIRAAPSCQMCCPSRQVCMPNPGPHPDTVSRFGTTWRDAGSLSHKQNVFDDFIACAEKLHADGYSSPKTLTIQVRVERGGKEGEGGASLAAGRDEEGWGSSNAMPALKRGERCAE